MQPFQHLQCTVTPTGTGCEYSVTSALSSIKVGTLARTAQLATTMQRFRPALSAHWQTTLRMFSYVLYHVLSAGHTIDMFFMSLRAQRRHGLP
jgi:hypothetical protein